MSEKEKNAEERERDLKWMENLKVESRYLKVCNEFRAVIRCMKAGFYSPGYQKLLMCPLIKRLVRACFKTWGRAFETLDQAFEGFREN